MRQWSDSGDSGVTVDVVAGSGVTVDGQRNRDEPTTIGHNHSSKQSSVARSITSGRGVVIDNGMRCAL